MSFCPQHVHYELAARRLASTQLIGPFGMARLESGLSMRVVDDLGDLHELHAWRDTVETYHHVPQLLSEEALHCLLRLQA